MHDPTAAAAAARSLPPDVVASPLYSDDLAPVPAESRNWTAWNFAALWISMAHCIPTYMLAGGLISSGMSWKEALLTIGLGNLIVLIPILLNAHPGTRYGIPFPVLARSSFGTVGANIPAVLRAVVACGWFGIQTFIGGEAVKTFLVALWPGYDHIGGGAMLLGLTLPSAITFLLFWALNILIIYRGMNAVRVFENWAAPIVLVMAVVLLGWAVSVAGGLGPMMEKPSKYATFAEFWPAFVPALTGMIGFWATLSLNIPDFTRYGRGQRDQMIGQTLGLPTTMIAFSMMGVMITSASQTIFTDPAVQQKLWDPVFLLSQMTSAEAPYGLPGPLIASGAARAGIAVISLLGVAIATISVSPNPATAAVGRTVALTAVAKDAQGIELTGRIIAWSSSAEAKLRPALLLTCTWLMPGRRYSTGSSTVITLSSGRLTMLKVTLTTPGMAKRARDRSSRASAPEVY